ncbi:MAG: LytTR family DNA-binding domain-containing protein [Clostridia bacterium]|nr:LytTR family DNA-binding domain-containing protein [Clostridia bacterium]
MRIAVCEDMQSHADILIDMIHKWAASRGKRAEAVHYKNAEAFLFHWSKDNLFDLAFLDIEMGSLNGLELAARIRREDQGMLIVFTTGLREYIVRGYEVQAFRYMLKPIKEKDVFKVLDSAVIALQKKKTDTFVIIQETQSKRLFKDEIYYFEMDNHYIIAHTLKGTIRYKEKMSHLEQILGEPHFCKCHRSYLVNLAHVATINREQVEIDNTDILPVSRSRWEALNQCFLGYHHIGRDRM